MKLRKLFCVCLALAVCLAFFSGCGSSAPAVSADLSYTSANLSLIPISEEVRVVGLGEASHGVAQYHQMKVEVFKSLVENNGCRTFIIEGDFGSALKVDEYINGGSGSAEEAAGEIGFSIYRTQEMAGLIEWMREYNKTAPPERTLHFYGMDVQAFDNNKGYLFSVLDQAAPELSAEYTAAFEELTDENRYSLDPDALKSAKESALQLLAEMDAAQPRITGALGSTAFEFARECANTILAFCNVQLSEGYNTTRDRCMCEKVEWFLQHGDGSVLFINGHNGHIGKTFAGYTCLGELLSKSLGEGYYAIGTDAQITQFNSWKDEGGVEVVEVRNANELNSPLAGTGGRYFIDLANAQLDKTWYRILNSEQTVTTLNVGLPKTLKLVKFFYTTKIVPSAVYDGMIVFEAVDPSTLLEG